MMIITLKYKGTCNRCETPLPKGTQAHWRRRHGVTCLVCKPTKESIAQSDMAQAQAAWNNRDKTAWRKMEDAYPATCPTCHTVGALTAYEIRKGYQCQACTRAAEFGAETVKGSGHVV